MKKSKKNYNAVRYPNITSIAFFYACCNGVEPRIAFRVSGTNDISFGIIFHS